MAIAPHAPKPKPAAPTHKLHLAFKEREYFIENLALLLKAGVSVTAAIASLATTARSRTMKGAMAQMQNDIEAGSGLGEALERSGAVSPQTLALVRLGEQSGHLVENMELASQQEEKRHIFHSKVRSALIYPTFVLGLTFVVGLGVAWFLLPRLAATFSQLQVKLPAISRVMIGLGTFLKEHGAIVLPVLFLVVAIAFYVVFVAPRTKWMGQRVLFALPGVSRLMREVEVAQFGYLLGTLLDAGLPITKAVNLLAESTTAIEYQKFYRYIAAALDDGHSFEQCLKSYKHVKKLLPPSVTPMIGAGEQSGSLAKVLGTIGRTYEQKADVTTQNLEAIVEPILLVIVWFGVMAVAVAVIVPIYSLVGGLGQ